MRPPYPSCASAFMCLREVTRRSACKLAQIRLRRMLARVALKPRMKNRRVAFLRGDGGIGPHGTSCPEFTAQGARRRALVRDARIDVLRTAVAVKRYVTRALPRVIMMEQSSGLRSHHRASYRMFNRVLRALPYEWYHGQIDAADLGASHHRRRLGWIGVRRV